MKKYIVSLCLSSLMLGGCNSLDLNPLSSGSSESWYSNETEVEMSLNRLFHIQFWESIQFDDESYMHKDSWTDNWAERTSIQPTIAGTLNSQSPTVTNLWNTCYRCIAASNLLIEKLPNATMSDEKKLRAEANARFARAGQYALLIFYFGDVPFYTDNLTQDAFYSLSRTDKATVLKQIYEDFDFAATHLPVSYGSSENKYSTQGAAYAMKARIALWMHDYATARDAAKACMDMNVYQLHDNYGDYFLPGTASSSPETIFANPRSIGDKVTAWYSPKRHVMRLAGGWDNGNASWDLLNAYECTDGLPIDESPLYDPHNPFKNRDPRCTMTIQEFGKEMPGQGIIFQPHPDSLQTLNVKTGQMISNRDSRGVDQYASYNGLIFCKGSNANWISDFWENENVVMRYADVLLMYAEAKIELNEIDQSVLDAMNQVRARAYGVPASAVSDYPAVTETNQKKLRRIVRRERRVEFAFEGSRYEDLIRWKLASKALNQPIYGMLLNLDNMRERIVNPGRWFFPEVCPIDEDGLSDFSGMYQRGLVELLVPKTFDDRQYLFPIPSTELLINPNLTQNPGW